jgi:hypothetical protein
MGLQYRSVQGIIDRLQAGSGSAYSKQLQRHASCRKNDGGDQEPSSTFIAGQLLESIHDRS